MERHSFRKNKTKKKQRNLRVSIRGKSITNYLNKFFDKGLETNKSFWKLIKPFLTNKGTLTDCNITIVDGKKIISNFQQPLY